MLNVIGWLENKFLPIPHAPELRGKTLREMERKLRELGYGRAEAKHFVWQHKARLRGT